MTTDCELLEQKQSCEKWRLLGLKFAGDHLRGLSHLRRLLADHEAHAQEAKEFLSASPMSLEVVQAEHDAIRRQAIEEIVGRLEKGFGASHAAPSMIRREFL